MVGRPGNKDTFVSLVYSSCTCTCTNPAHPPCLSPAVAEYSLSLETTSSRGSLGASRLCLPGSRRACFCHPMFEGDVVRERVWVCMFHHLLLSVSAVGGNFNILYSRNFCMVQNLAYVVLSCKM